MKNKIGLTTSILFCIIMDKSYAIDKAITLINESMNDVIMVISAAWCTPGHSPAQETYYMLCKQALSTSKNQSKSIPRIDNICFCSPLSAQGGSVTYRPEKFSLILGLPHIQVFAFDPVNNILGSKQNARWGDIITYPKTMNREMAS